MKIRHIDFCDYPQNALQPIKKQWIGMPHYLSAQHNICHLFRPVAAIACFNIVQPRNTTIYKPRPSRLVVNRTF